MPQTANSIHYYVRRGGYEPGFGLHTTAFTDQAPALMTSMLATILPMLSGDVVLTRWEFQNALGTVLAEGIVDEGGLWNAAFQDFTDCTHFSWVTTGPKGNSGMFLHPRPIGAFAYGTATVLWAAAVAAFAGAVISGPWTDSEGFPITGLRAVRPSRRRRVRMAP